MKRRNFLKNIGLSSVAAGTMPVLSGFKNPERLKYKNDNPEGSINTTYKNDERVRTGIALGGIGAGFVELRRNGQFYNWNIFNNQPKGTGPVFYPNDAPYYSGWEDGIMFFVVRYHEQGSDMPKMKLLQLPNSLNEGSTQNYGNIYIFPWLKAVKNIEYNARFPFVHMKFSDPEMPFDVEMEAFTPFIPHDVKNSSLPGVYFNFNIISKSQKKVDVMLIASQRNMAGYETNEKYFISEIHKKDGYIFMNQTVGGMDESSFTHGQMGMASLSDNSTYYLGWSHHHPYYEQALRNNTLPNINDTDGTKSMNKVPEWMPKTNGRNMIDKETGKKIAYPGKEGHQRSLSSIANSTTLNPGDTFTHSFIFTWNFPNYYAKKINDDPTLEQKEYKEFGRNIGNYYSNFFKSALDVANYMKKNKEILSKRTEEFLTNYYASDIDQYVLDQINSHLNTFVVSGWLTKEGVFGVREGMAEDRSYAGMFTIDVALYGSVMVSALFPELEKSAIRAHAKTQGEKGEINHSLPLDVENPKPYEQRNYHRVDMPGNFVEMAMRDYFWTGDKKFLKDVWPNIKKAINYILSYRDKDNDQMPDMEGIMCSYDNFPMYGLASYIQSQWLAAMASAAKGAEAIGDNKAKRKYATILKDGMKLMEDKLWNGEFYRISNDYHGEHGKNEGCLTDQMIGQWIAHQSGLGYIHNKERIRKAMKSILSISYRKDYFLKNYGEKGKWLLDVAPERWVDQANTPWTGVELAFASFLLYEGLYEDAMKVIKTVDHRYREEQLYWNHIECGGHYFRPMSSWAIINALLGLKINLGTYSFAPVIPKNNFKMFFAYPDGTAHYIAKNAKVRIKILTGKWNCTQLRIQHAILSDVSSFTLNGKKISCKIKNEEGVWILIPQKPIFAKAGQEIVIA